VYEPQQHVERCAAAKRGSRSPRLSLDHLDTRGIAFSDRPHWIARRRGELVGVRRGNSNGNGNGEVPRGGLGRGPHDRALTAVDLFAGAGGFSLGLRRAGFDVILANEYSVDAEWTYRHNLLGGTWEGVFPERPAEPTGRARKAYRAAARKQMMGERDALARDYDRHMRGGDIREVLPNQWLRRWLDGHSAGIDVLVAGPPCQGFSCAGKACPDDERNLLVHEALRVIRVLQPRVAIIENVPGMLERHSSLVREIGLGLSRRSKNRPGYHVFAELVHGEPLGVPQTRRRLLIVGVRRDLVPLDAVEKLPSLLFPVACPQERPADRRLFGTALSAGSALAAKEILGDLAASPPPFGSGEKWTQPYRRNGRHAPSTFLREVRATPSAYLDGRLMDPADRAAVNEYFNHEASSHLPDVARRLQLLREAAASSAEARQHRCSSAWLRRQFIEQFPALVTKKASQRVLLPDEWPMLTVTSLPDDIVHHAEDRIPTVREVARLQTFPDWFEFKGVRTTGAERRRAGVYVPQYTQVANAVPPRLAHAVAARIRQFLLLVEGDPACDFTPDGGLYVTSNVKGTARERLDEIDAALRAADNPRRGRNRGSTVRGASLAERADL
jgi:DNA (cytosine-5)-methyltransferase 1